METLHTLVIGAGFAGICAAVKLDQAGIADFAVIDKNGGIGGTWYANIYPGATCDVASHFYSFSFAPNPDWSQLYSPQPEIRAYMEDVVDRFGVRDRFRLGQEVAGATWDTDRRGWVVDISGRDPVFARFLVNAMGLLHRPAWPDIPGRDSFRGKAMHTALWDAAYDPAGRRIAVIGSAASAIQVIPQVAKTAAHVDVYQRTANYIAPRMDQSYSDEARALFAKHPETREAHRQEIMERMDTEVYPTLMDPARRHLRAAEVNAAMREAVTDPSLHAKLTPDYEFGCKRVLISDDFYDALNRDNVDLVTDPIARITPEGVEMADGTLRAADTLVFATGFDIRSQYTALDLAGPGGQRLGVHWSDRVEAYKGVMVAGFPNYFMSTGPNTGVGTTSIVHMIEQATGWILMAMEAAGPTGTVDVLPTAQSAYNDRIHHDLSGTVWATGCHSWYRRPDGRIETLYPGNAADFTREMETLDRADLHLG
ncbi:flavin-containing monooxygenase [Chachezhania sediminis]|uniref:flavin-containing monooxygenase n=1 Tax=Chachezhania sediminis TaxID=2599291 RepID=UPI00131E7AEF|nr:NAD(P)/FAD-dependent oxidoreductase [Chachezhania sediminis]